MGRRGGAGQEGRGRAELGRRGLRRGTPARTQPPPSPPSPASLGERQQSAPSHPLPLGEAHRAGRGPPGPWSPVPGCGARGAGAVPPPCPAPAAGGPDASGSVRPGRHVSRAARCIVGRGRAGELRGRAALPGARTGPWPARPAGERPCN